MKPAHLQAFVASIATGSFSKAADVLCVTQSAVSRRIQHLEEEYGYPLIDRSGPVLVPTEAGRILMEKAHRMLDLEKELLLDLRGLEKRKGVGFGCSPAFGIAYLPEIMKVFMLSHSTVSEMNFSFEVPDKVIEGLREGGYQAGVIEHFEEFDFSGFEIMPLPDDEVVFVSSPSLGIDESNVSIDHLITFDIYMRKEGCCSTKLLAYNMLNNDRNSNEFARTIVCDDLHLIISTVCEGSGITFVSRSLVKHQIQSGVLKEHHLPLFRHTQQRTLLVKRTIPEDPLLKDFIDCISAVF
ncbi:MAG TPA: LysR family transcriptional regulator [Desulfuromonadales bacterium]|nr:LysR family transcriptional regulator [Desulfuromonadales bacterium]